MFLDTIEICNIYNFFWISSGGPKPFKIALFSDCLKVLILLTSRAMQSENIPFKAP